MTISRISEDDSTFTITIPQTYTFKKGWGVLVECLYVGENEEGRNPDAIEDIEIELVEIAPERVEVIGGIPCVFGPSQIGVPVETFLDVPNLDVDDTHDLRSRWFATKGEAGLHAASVKQLWEHPNPWTGFVRTN